MTAHGCECEIIEADADSLSPSRKQEYRIRRPVTTRKRVTHHRRTQYVGIRHRRPKTWNW